MQYRDTGKILSASPTVVSRIDSPTTLTCNMMHKTNSAGNISYAKRQSHDYEEVVECVDLTRRIQTPTIGIRRCRLEIRRWPNACDCQTVRLPRANSF